MSGQAVRGGANDPQGVTSIAAAIVDESRDAFLVSVPSIITNEGGGSGERGFRRLTKVEPQWMAIVDESPSASRSLSAACLADSRVGKGPTNTRNNPLTCRILGSTPSGASWFARCATKFCALA